MNKQTITLIGLMSVAIVLLGCSTLQMSHNVGFYGLIHSFPPMYFVGLGLLGISFILSLRSNQLSNKFNNIFPALHILILLIALWLLPLTAGSPPGLSMAYRSLQHIGVISTQGLGNINNWYLSWPGFQALFSIINFNPPIVIFPFLIQLLYLPPLLIFLRNILQGNSTKGLWIGVWIFYMGNWLGQDYFGPQSLAFLLLLIILALVTHKSLWEGSRRTRLTMTAVLVVVYSYLVITHLLTSLVVICLLAAYALVKKSPRLVITTVICIVLLFNWDIGFGGHYILRLYGEDHGYRLLEQKKVPLIVVEDTSMPVDNTTTLPAKTGGYTGIIALDPGYILESNILSSLSGSESHITVVQVRIAYSSLFVVLGLMGAIFILTRKRKQTNLALLAMALSILLLLPLRYAGWELVQRLYMFELPFVAYFGAILWDTKKLRLIIPIGILITASPILFLVCHYGNQAADYWSPNYKMGYEYTQEYATDYDLGTLRDIKLVDGEITTNLTGPYYLAISNHDDEVYSFLYGDPNFVDDLWKKLKESPYHTSIYKNPEFELFLGKTK